MGYTRPTGQLEDIDFLTLLEQYFFPPSEPCNICREPTLKKCELNHEPPVLVLEFHEELCRQTGLRDLNQLPGLLRIPHDVLERPVAVPDDDAGSELYFLSAATFADGAHFRATFASTGENAILEDGWYFYDGLSGHCHVGLLPPCTPGGSTI